MFGNSRRLTLLEAHLQASNERQAAENQRLRDELARLKELLARQQPDPARRTQLLLQEVDDEIADKLRKGLEQANQATELLAQIGQLREQTLGASRATASKASRVRVLLNRVYEAKWTGYVSIYFEGGVTDKVRLYVGETNPPDECVCELNTRNDINSYAGGVVRAGELWLATSMHKEGSQRSGVKCMFTPFL